MRGAVDRLRGRRGCLAGGLAVCAALAGLGCGEVEPRMMLVPSVVERGSDVALTIDDISPGPLRAGAVLLESKREDGSWRAEYAIGLRDPSEGGRMEPVGRRRAARALEKVAEVDSATIEMTIPRSTDPRATWRLTRSFSVDPDVPPSPQSVRLTIAAN